MWSCEFFGSAACAAPFVGLVSELETGEGASPIFCVVGWRSGANGDENGVAHGAKIAATQRVEWYERTKLVDRAVRSVSVCTYFIYINWFL